MPTNYPHISYALTSITLYTLLLIVPAIIGLFHQIILTPKRRLLIYANYYIGFNIMLSAFFTASAYIFDGQSMAQVQNWAYSPMFIEYGILQAAIFILALISLWKNPNFKAVTIYFYTVYLFFFSMTQIIQMIQEPSLHKGSETVELIYSLLLLVILRWFYKRLKKDI